MKAARYHSVEMQAARRIAADRLRSMGAETRPRATNVQLAAMIAERTGWPLPAATPADLLPFLLRFIDLGNSSVTPAPYRPVQRRPMRFDLAMRLAAARAAAVQPTLIPASSNIVTWRELPL